jgi:hypothetical protein
MTATTPPTPSATPGRPLVARQYVASEELHEAARDLGERVASPTEREAA